jgi:hypothetical protein
LCGVVMPFDDECVVVFVGPEACLPYHQWCWDTVKERLVFVRRRVEDNVSIQDLVDLGLFKWHEEGDEPSKEDAVGVAPEDAAAAPSDTEDSVPRD